MKKLISLFLVLVLICGVFAGCGDKKTEAVLKDTPTEEQKTTEVASIDVTVEEAVLFEEAGVKATVTGIYEEPTYVIFSIRVENTSERDIELYKYDYATVNGVPVYAAIDIDASAGRTVEEDWYGLMIMKKNLDQVGIQAIATISMSDIELTDRNTNEVIAKVSIDIVTSLGADFVKESTSAAEVVYEAGGVSVAYQPQQEGVFSRGDKMVVTNANEYDVSVSFMEVSYGFDIDAFDSVTVPAGETGFCIVGEFYGGKSKDGKLYYEISITDLNNNSIGQSETLSIKVD